ncbi:MAG: glycosyltransferase family 4 protein [Microbacterium sp.]
MRLVFLGRLVEHKGLHVAIAALALVQTAVILDVYGTPEQAVYLERCRKAARELGSNVTVNFMGEVAPDLVRTVLAEYEAMVSPTRGENFGHVIAESLSTSCVVITSTTTPWTPVLEDGGGVAVDGLEPARWAHAIDELGALPSSDRLERRRLAGAAYERWRSAPKGEHVFTLVAHAADQMDGS